MSAIDRATGRVMTVIVLLILVGASLRGYLPATERPIHRKTADSPATLTVLAVLLATSVGILGVAFVARMRNRRAVPSSIAALSRLQSDHSERPSRRVLLIGLAVISAWLFSVWLLSRWVDLHGVDSLAGPAPADGGAPPVATPPSISGAAPTSDLPQRNSSGDMFGYLRASVIALLLLVVARIAIAIRDRRGRPRQPAPGLDARQPPDAAATGPEFLVRAAELGLAEIGEPGRAPREAIIACYAAMERELAHLPDAAPQDFDTPSEVLARAVQHHALTADNAAQLVKLFAEARFSSHLMTERHREIAVRVLRLVLAELRSRA